MSQVQMFMAAPEAQRLRPAFTVEVLDGEQEVVKYRKTDKGLEQFTEMEPRGFLVRFLKGHSIHVKTREEMRRLKLDRFVPMIDTKIGEEVPDMQMQLNLPEPRGKAATKGS